MHRCSGKDEADDPQERAGLVSDRLLVPWTSAKSMNEKSKNIPVCRLLLAIPDGYVVVNSACCRRSSFSFVTVRQVEWHAEALPKDVW